MYKWPERKSLRMKNFDYNENGYYFVTICTKNRENKFGEIVWTEMVLNEYGEIVENIFLELSEHYVNCKLDKYVVMPNHFHWIIIIDNTYFVGNGFKPFPKDIKLHWLSEIVRWFKTFSSRKINNIQNDFIFSWQKSFYDRIIRNEKELLKIREYIEENPLKWHLDKNNLL